jgi:hypothetical protein
MAIPPMRPGTAANRPMDALTGLRLQVRGPALGESPVQRRPKSRGAQARKPATRINLRASPRRMLGFLTRPPSSHFEEWEPRVQLYRSFPVPSTPLRVLRRPGYVATPSRVAPLCSGGGGPYGAPVWVRSAFGPVDMKVCRACEAEHQRRQRHSTSTAPRGASAPHGSQPGLSPARKERPRVVPAAAGAHVTARFAPVSAEGGRCSVAGCGRRAVARGLCTTHTMRVRSGLPLDTPVRSVRVYSEAEVQLARARAAVIGIKATARELGIPRATIQQWFHGRRRTD